MAVSTLPTSKEIEFPLLQLLSDGKEHRWKEIVDELADHFFLTDKKLDERLPSGQKRFYHRCAFARLDLKQDALVESPRREYWKITKRGINESF
jgi:restriction system protein